MRKRPKENVCKSVCKCSLLRRDRESKWSDNVKAMAIMSPCRAKRLGLGQLRFKWGDIVGSRATNKYSPSCKSTLLIRACSDFNERPVARLLGLKKALMFTCYFSYPISNALFGINFKVATCLHLGELRSTLYIGSHLVERHNS